MVGVLPRCPLTVLPWVLLASLSPGIRMQTHANIMLIGQWCTVRTRQASKDRGKGVVALGANRVKLLVAGCNKGVSRGPSDQKGALNPASIKNWLLSQSKEKGQGALGSDRCQG